MQYGGESGASGKGGNPGRGHAFYDMHTMMKKIREEYPSEKLHGEPWVRKTRDVYVLIPNAGEHPRAIYNTMKEIGMTNLFSEIIWGTNFNIKDVILCDQSGTQKVKINEGELATVKDYLRETYASASKENIMPNIYQLEFGKEIDEIIGDYSSKFYGDVLMKYKMPRGKGWNMLVSSLATGARPDDETCIICMDAENQQIRSEHLIALGWLMYNMDSKVKFCKSAFERTHMVADRRMLGGRVNNSVFKPLIDMMYDAGLLPQLYYPLSGEIAVRRDAFWDIKVARGYPVEWTMILQFLSDLFGTKLDLKDEFAEIYIGHNQDQPLAEGKSKRTIMEGIGRMTSAIMADNNNLKEIGGFIKDKWEDSEVFIKDFIEYQDTHMKNWCTRFKSKGEPAGITGGIEADELKRYTRRVLEKSMRSLYSDTLPESDLLVPMREVKEALGESRFAEFKRSVRERMIKFN